VLLATLRKEDLSVSTNGSAPPIATT
jgi:hypothetical protein